MFVDDSCKMSPGEGSWERGAEPARGVRSLSGGRDLCPAGPEGVQGTGEGVPARSLAPRIPALPGDISRVLPRGGERGLGAPPAWEGSGLSLAHFRARFPASLAPELATRSRKQRAAGEDAPGLGPAGPSAPVRRRPRQGCVGPGRAFGLLFLPPVPPPRGAWSQKERVDTLRGSSDPAVGEKLPPRNSPGTAPQ